MPTAFTVELRHDGDPLNSVGASNVITRGVPIQFAKAATVTGFRVFSDSTSPYQLRLWRLSDGLLIASASASLGPSGWQGIALPSAVTVQSGVTYVLGYLDSPGVRFTNIAGRGQAHTHTSGLLTVDRLAGDYSAGNGDVMPTGFANNDLEYLLGVAGTTNDPPGTPGAFTAPTAGQTVNTTATVTFGAASDVDGDALAYDVELSTDNGASFTVIRSNQPGTSFTYDFTNVPATTAAVLRARARDTSGATSGYTTGPTFRVEHNVAPTPPTLLAPVGNASLDRTAVQRFSWQFNDTAGDTQSKRDLRYRIVGAPAWTVGTVTTTALLHDFPANTFAAGSYEWQVQTYDSQGLASGYSGSEFFTAITPPVGPTILTPANNSTIGLAVGVVEWSYPTQQAYQVRKVADAGGSPDTANVLFDTGIVENATARTVALTYPVNNRAEHVQVRIRENGLWSPYSSVRVTVSYATPHTPKVSVAAVNTSTTGGGTDAISVGIAPVVKNLLTVNQSSLETDTTGWNGNVATVARSTAQAFDGAASLAVTASGPSQPYSVNTPIGTAGAAVTAGQVYTAAAHLRAATVARAAQVRLFWYGPTGTYLNIRSDGALVADNTAGWQQARVTAQAPAGAAFVALEVYWPTGATGEVHYVDAVGLFADPTGNLVRNSDMEGGVVDNALNPWVKVDGSETVTASSEQAYTGGRSQKVVTTGALQGIVLINFPLVVGTTYTYSYYVYSPVASTYRIRKTDGNASVNVVQSDTPVVANTWTRLTLTFTATNATNTYLWVQSLSAGSFYVDAAQVVVGSAPVEYLPPTTHNLVTNPSFEVDTAGWSAGNATIARQTNPTRVAVGTASLNVTPTANGDVDVVGTTTLIPAGSRVTLSLSFFGSGTVDFNMGGATSRQVVTFDGGFKRISATLVLVNAATTFVFKVNSATAGGNFYIDAVQVEAGSVATPYTDGSLGGYEYGPNLLSAAASGFEDGTTGGWLGDSGGTVAHFTGRAYSGSGSLEVRFTTGGPESNGASRTLTGLTVGATYRASAWVFNFNGAPSAGIYLTNTAKAYTTVGGAWTQVAVSFVASSTTQYFAILSGASTTAGQTVYVDTVEVTRQTSAGGYRWDASENTVPNPAAVTDTTGATGFHQGGTAATTVQRSTGEVVPGTSITTAFRYIIAADAARTVWQAELVIGANPPLAPNTTYTLSFYTARGAASATYHVHLRDNPGGNAALVLGSFTTAAAWARYTYTFTTPATVFNYRLFLIADTPATAHDIFLTGVQVEQRPYATAYAAPGTPDASTSTRQYPWDLPRPAVTAVDVFRREGGVGDGIRVAAGLAPTTTYVDRTPGHGVDYQYRVRALTAAGAATDTEWIG